MGLHLRPTVDQSLGGGGTLIFLPSRLLAPSLCFFHTCPFLWHHLFPFLLPTRFPAWSFFLVLSSDSFSQQAFLGHFLCALCGDRYKGESRSKQ